MPEITLDDVLAAHRRLGDVVHRTPVMSSRTFDEHADASLLLKLESFQRTGSFKLRGAWNRIATLPGDAHAGVLAFSSGNHAQAVAFAAGSAGRSATIVMPEDVAAIKLAATRAYGAEVVTYDRVRGDREKIAAQLAEERGLTLVRPYDDDAVMAGQGTLAVELVEDAGPIDVLVAPVGGGGLIAGCATAVKGLAPATRVVGVEPAARDVTARSVREGRRLTVDVPETIADGLQATSPGERTFEINRRLVDEFVAVSDAEIADTMRLLFERMKVVVEPSGATALAAVLAGKIDVRGARVGVVVSGGNVDAARFHDVVADVQAQASPAISLRTT